MKPFRWVRRIFLFLTPPKKNQVFIGNASHFMKGYVESVLHGLRDYGGKLNANTWHGENTYRLTVESISMPYYILKAEVLAWIPTQPFYEWKKRSQSRRIMKSKFHDLILNGVIRRIE